MNVKNYPLHPGQDHVPPYYVQVPQSEYESLKRENEQLHALLHDAPKQSATAEINTLTSEVKALREMNAKAQEEIATLKENQRWRNFPDERPEHNGIYIVLLGEHTRTLDVYYTDKGKFRTYKPTAWMPIPKASEEA